MSSMSIIFLCLFLSQTFAFDSLSFSVLTANNTGPTNRSRPFFECFPKSSDGLINCLVVSGATFTNSNFPDIFYNDAWLLKIDPNSNTLKWTALDSSLLTSESTGTFGQFWRPNATSLSMTASLQNFNPSTFTATCGGQTIITYDWKNQRAETKVPQGGNWAGTTGGACDTYQDNQGNRKALCWGGFSCATFSDQNRLTEYDIKTNTLRDLTPVGLSSFVGRHHSSVTCFQTQKRCLLGTGDLLGGGAGTVNNLAYYYWEQDRLEIFTPVNGPQGIQYVSIDHGELWVVNRWTGEYDVVYDEPGTTLFNGGDSASGVPGTSNTTRIVGRFILNLPTTNKYTQYFNTSGLFTIKQQYLKSVPKLVLEFLKPTYFVEFGGFEQNPNVPLHYPNKVVLYKLPLLGLDHDEE